jgi:hypothetical protein
MGKKHAPSAYRSLVKESKSGSGKSPIELAKAARALPDPYYASLALISISLDRRLDSQDAKKLTEESLALADRENRPWRKAELLTEICKKAQNAPFKDDLMKSLFKRISTISDGQARAEAISGCVGNMGCQNAAGLLNLGISNEKFEMESCKPVIKFMVESCNAPAADIMAALEKMPQSLARAKLLGYLHTQLQRSGSCETEALESAVNSALQLSGAEKMDALKYLASQSSDLTSLETVAAAIISLKSPLEVAVLLATLAGSADKAGQKELSKDWFMAGIEAMVEFGNETEYVQLKFNLALGLQRLGEEKQARDIFTKILETSADDDKMISRVRKAMGEKPDVKIVLAKHERKTRHMLVLYDTHEGSLSQVHLRMVARAAPLCVAYGLDLGLMAFPDTDLDSLVKRVTADTNIGQGGRYLQELAEEKRISILAGEEWKSVGLPVATTSHPAKDKSISLEDAGKLAKDHPGKRLLVIMGLGKKGLPKSLLDAVEHHVELTGSNVPLETSTAMGIIAQQMGHLSKD